MADIEQQARELLHEICEQLAAIVMVPTSDELYDLNAIPRDPVMTAVSRASAARTQLEKTIAALASQPQAPAPAWPDLLALAATFETCIPFLPSVGQKNIATAVESLRQIALAPAAAVPVNDLDILVREWYATAVRIRKDGYIYDLPESGVYEMCADALKELLAAAPAPEVSR